MSPVDDPGFFRPFNLALLACMVLTLASLSMVAVWTALSRWPWYLRVGTLFGVVALLSFIPANEAAGFLLVQGLLVWLLIGLLQLARHLEDHPSWKLRFRVRHIMLATALVAALLGLVLHLRPLFSQVRFAGEVSGNNRFFTSALIAAFTAVAAVWTITRPKHWLVARLALLLCTLLFCCVWFVDCWLQPGNWLGLHNGFRWLVAPERLSYRHFVGELMIVPVGSTLILLLWLRIWRGRQECAAERGLFANLYAWRPAGGRRAMAVFALVSAPVMLLFVRIGIPCDSGEQEWPRSALDIRLHDLADKLNEDFKSAGQSWSQSQAKSDAAFAQLAGSDVLAARKLVHQAWMVSPEKYSGSPVPPDWREDLGYEFSSMYRFCLRQKQYDEAAAYAMARIELFSYPYPRPSLNTLEERSQIIKLVAIAPQLSPACRARVIGFLRRVEASHLSRDLRSDNDSRAITYFVTEYYGNDWRMRLWNEIRLLVSARRDYDLRGWLRDNSTFLRLGQTELALAGYRRDHGRRPNRLSELVPQYLPAVPRDPYGDGELMYRRTKSGYLVYGVGEDGRDDGGTPVDLTKYFDGVQQAADLSLVDPAPANAAATTASSGGSPNASGGAN